MKKFLSLILSLAIILSLSSTALAAEGNAKATTRDGIIGEIIYEETTPSSLMLNSLSEPTETVHTIISGTANADDSVTTYQYENDQLIEFHTTFPGSGLVVSTYINDDGTRTIKETITKDSPQTETKPSGDMPISTFSSTALSSTQILSPTSIRSLGYMHYRHNFTDQIFSINCEVREKYHGYEYYTFNKGVANSLSFWTNSIISIFAFHKTLANVMANAIFQRAVAYGILGFVINKGYEVLITRTLPCYWYDQEIHGTPTSPAGRGSERYLPGVYAFVDYGSGLEKRTEGYTVSDWGNASMGRWMMYNVFAIDESPTSWTGLDLR